MASATPSPDHGPVAGGTTVTIPEPPPAVNAVAGNTHSVALDYSGNAYAGGNNTAGKLGDGSTTARDTPVPVVLPTDVKFTSISAGYTTSVAIGTDGRMYVWGYGEIGQRGDGTTATEPVAVPFPETSP